MESKGEKKNKKREIKRRYEKEMWCGKILSLKNTSDL